MEEYIAGPDGHIDYPGVTALYPPGTKVFLQNGQYAGHESPIESPVQEELAQEPTPSPLQGLSDEQVQPPAEEHPPVEQEQVSPTE